MRAESLAQKVACLKRALIRVRVKNHRQIVIVQKALVGCSSVIFVIIVLQAASKGQTQWNCHQDWIEGKPKMVSKQRQSRGSLEAEHHGGDSRTVCNWKQ